VAGNYSAAWTDLRRRRLIAWLTPAALLLASWISGNFSRVVPIVCFVVAIVVWFPLQRWYERWPCPRCGERFTQPGSVHSACVSCGLERPGRASRSGAPPASLQ